MALSMPNADMKRASWLRVGAQFRFVRVMSPPVRFVRLHWAPPQVCGSKQALFSGCGSQCSLSKD